jgi:hypothetical protein
MFLSVFNVTFGDGLRFFNNGIMKTSNPKQNYDSVGRSISTYDSSDIVDCYPQWGTKYRVLQMWEDPSNLIP